MNFVLQPRRTRAPKPPRIPKLTPVREKVLNAIRSYIHDHNGLSPSLTELCEATGMLSTSTVYNHLEKLERSGHIKRIRSGARSIELCHPPESVEKRLLRGWVDYLNGTPPIDLADLLTRTLTVLGEPSPMFGEVPQ